jgi:hypothetical protein
METKVILALHPSTGDMMRVTSQAEAEHLKSQGYKLFVMSGRSA